MRHMERRRHSSIKADTAWSLVDEKLADLGVPDPMRTELRTKVDGHGDALLLYGSWARGDADADSDLDVLLLHTNASFPRDGGGKVSLAQHDPRQLKELSGTLFGYHLARDGMILSDPNRTLTRALASILPPTRGSVISRIRSLTPVLDLPDADRQAYIEGLTKVARYLLRSAMYAQALDDGQPCFSVREIAARRHDPALVTVLSSHPGIRPPATTETFDDLCRRLTEIIGSLEPNSYCDLHGLVEETWTDKRELSNFATLVLAEGDDELPYDELPKVTL
jgi:Nucleotidyltransferase domain